MAKKSGRFKFRKNDIVGAPAAEEDEHFLSKCFIDAGDLDVLRNTENPKRLIIGRTGAGKTALLMRLRDIEEHVIEISPYNLSIEFISNSNTIRFFADAGVNLELFYKLLWRHIFTVEIIREKYKIYTKADQSRFLESIVRLLQFDSRRKRALDFLKEHGGSFFKEHHERVQEATKKTEEELKAAVSGKLPGISFDLGGLKRLTEEQKSEVRQFGQDVVNRVTIRDLNEMFSLLKEDLLDDKQERYFLIIDGLDDRWVDDSIRFNLIRALIDTIREFQKVRTVKIIACLRTDLIERVFRVTRASGLQEEKMQGLYLHLRWTKEDLIRLIDSRIQQLARDAYTTATITYMDVLPKGKRPPTYAIEYILKRTMYRPRDMIAFLNACIAQATDSPKITGAMLKSAEGEYSRGRLRALGDEWTEDYPHLLEVVALFKGFHYHFIVRDIDDSLLMEFCLEFLAAVDGQNGYFVQFAEQYFNSRVDGPTFRKLLVAALYRVGFVGIKAETFTGFEYASPEKRSISTSDITDNCHCEIHPMYWRALGIVPPNRSRQK